MTDGWRYIAQRFDGKTGGLGDFIDFNVPLQGVDLQEVLSGHNSLSGTITPEYPRLKGADGKPILLRGGTALWAESPDGEIRGGGLITGSAFNDGGEWQIDCTDISGTSIGIPYVGGDYFINVDPLDIFRYIWGHLQSQRNHNLGITVDPLRSPVRLGNELVQYSDFDLEGDPAASAPEDLEPQPIATTPPRYATNKLWREAAVKAMRATGWKEDVVDDALRLWLNKDALVASGDWPKGGLTDKQRTIRDRSIDKVGWPPEPPSPGRNTINVVNMRPQMNPPNGGSPVVPAPEDNPSTEAGITLQYDAYKLNWYETLDLAAEIDNLAAETPFDWHLTHHWDGDEIRHHIRLGYPRIGRRREELRFVVGENIHTIPSVEYDGDEYANEVVVFGAGEGSAQIMARTFRPDDGRVRKVVVVSDPSIQSFGAALTRAEQELAKRFDVEDIAEVTIVDHPHAPIGSIDLGDEIFLEGDVGWVEFASWCRVVGRSIQPDNGDQQVLTLIRSDRIV